jgi:cobalt-precorrin-6B (C15)-methyltransferase
MAAKVVRQVYAIDDREEAIIAARKNILDEKIDNIKLLLGEAPSVLDKLPQLDCAFVGGTRNIEDVLHILKKKVKGRIVVNAVRIQTVSTIIETMQELDIFQEAIHVQVSKNYPLAGEIIFKPLNPVYILVGTTDHKKEE